MDTEPNRVADERTALFAEERLSGGNNHVVRHHERPLTYTFFLDYNYTPGHDSDRLVVRSLAHSWHVTKVTLYSSILNPD